MTVHVPRASHAVRTASSGRAGASASVGIVSYSTDHELTFFLRALQHVGDNTMVVVLGLREGGRVSPSDMPTSVRLILTTDQNGTDPNEGVGWFVPDPLRAVRIASAGLRPDEWLILLLPHDWCGPSPGTLLEGARHGCVCPLSPEMDDFFVVDQPNKLSLPHSTGQHPD
jgi:hypothetical protein